MNSTAHLTLVPVVASSVGSARSAGSAEGAPAVRRPATLRLTRRGRLVMVVLFLAALLAGGVLFGSTSTRATGEAGAPRDYQYLVVQPGQTLWGIAKDVAPQEDPRATIEAIRRLNALSGTGVEAGQRIALP